ncbi:MAG: aldehyde dehydrogenase family protein [Planctomycetaceae bacterium]|nr:aldehyde dehydrogenase family protein [Planctomycetaceae bacterium]
MTQRRKLLIGNEWVDAAETLAVRSPHTGEVVGEVAKAGPAEMERAVQAAVRGFDATRKLSSIRRSEILAKVAAGLAQRREELARTITSENAKTIKLSRGEVDRGIATFTIAAEEAKRIGGEVLPLDLNAQSEGRLGLTRRFPLGPIFGISPFNFPLNLVSHKVAPSMAAGNTLVLKPASSTPLSALLLGEVLLEAGMPPGMVNVTPCGADLADRLVSDERFKLVTFTGSPAVGWELKKKAGRKRVTLELGGNAAVIVESDADLDLAVERAVTGSFAYAGQVCISVQRIYLHERIADAFTHKFLERAKALVLGDPFDEKTDLGPMIDEKALAKTQAWVDEAARGGASVLCGGRRDGRYFPPTVLSNVKPEMKVHCSEVFAPVVNLYRYRDFPEALAAVNDSPYGLQAGVFARDVGRIFQAFESLEVGGVIVNDVPTWRVDSMPYGGEKESGQGREGVRYAIEEMTQLRLLALNLR